jgi:hypothetical protein
VNHVYRLTWNESLQQYVPAPETARGRHKGGKTKRKLIAAAVAAVLMGGAVGTYALPVGGQVSSGSGADAGNYTIKNTSIATKANITPLAITVTATSGNMVYDGSTKDTAAITLSSAGVIAGDVVNFTDTSATFSSKTVGNGKTVTVKGITESGGNASDYKLSNTTATTTANIAQ